MGDWLLPRKDAVNKMNSGSKELKAGSMCETRAPFGRPGAPIFRTRFPGSTREEEDENIIASLPSGRQCIVIEATVLGGGPIVDETMIKVLVGSTYGFMYRENLRRISE